MKRLVLGLVTCVAIVSACAHDEPPPVSTTSTTSATYRSSWNETAIRDITRERCTRELSCNRVGEGTHFVDMDSCRAEMSKDTGQHLRGSECPGAIHDWALSSCLSDLQSVRCDTPLDTLERVPSCRSGKLCR